PLARRVAVDCGSAIPRASQAELAEGTRACKPARLDLDERLEVNAAREEALELEARALTDPLDRRPALAEQDRALRGSSDEDRCVEHEQIPVLVLREVIDAHRRLIRHLFPGGEQDLLADDLRRKEALGEIRLCIWRVEGRRIGERALDGAQEL